MGGRLNLSFFLYFSDALYQPTKVFIVSLVVFLFLFYVLV